MKNYIHTDISRYCIYMIQIIKEHALFINEKQLKETKLFGSREWEQCQRPNL